MFIWSSSTCVCVCVCVCVWCSLLTNVVVVVVVVVCACVCACVCVCGVCVPHLSTAAWSPWFSRLRTGELCAAMSSTRISSSVSPSSSSLGAASAPPSDKETRNGPSPQRMRQRCNCVHRPASQRQVAQQRRLAQQRSNAPAASAAPCRASRQRCAVRLRSFLCFHCTHAHTHTLAHARLISPVSRRVRRALRPLFLLWAPPTDATHNAPSVRQHLQEHNA